MKKSEGPGTVTALHHVQVSCPAGSDDALRAFYAGVLGMDEVEKPPVLAARGGVWFRAGGCEIHCGVEAEFAPARKAHPGIVVAGLDDLVLRLGVAGVEVTWDDDFPGMRRVYVADPVGNRLELLEPSPT